MKIIDNEAVIAGEDNYFFNRASGQVTMNILLFLVTGILFFVMENTKNRTDKEPLKKEDNHINNNIEEKKDMSKVCNELWTGAFTGNGSAKGFFESANWYGIVSLIWLIVVTLFIETTINLFIFGSIAHFLSKDKSKKYFHTLKMSFKKRMQLLSSFTKIKIFFIVLCYLLYGFVIAIVARLIPKICCREKEQIN